MLFQGLRGKRGHPQRGQSWDRPEKHSEDRELTYGTNHHSHPRHLSLSDACRGLTHIKMFGIWILHYTDPQWPPRPLLCSHFVPVHPGHCTWPQCDGRLLFFSPPWRQRLSFVSVFLFTQNLPSKFLLNGWKCWVDRWIDGLTEGRILRSQCDINSGYLMRTSQSKTFRISRIQCLVPFVFPL